MIKSKYKILGLLAVICALVCIAFAGCGLNLNVDYEAVYNDDAKIATCTSCKRIASVGTDENGVYKLSCSSLSGVYTIKNSYTVNNNTSVNLNFSVADGKCKVVLIKGNNVYTFAEGGFNGELKFDGVPDGNYKLKLVGVNAEFRLTLAY